MYVNPQMSTVQTLWYENPKTTTNPTTNVNANINLSPVRWLFAQKVGLQYTFYLHAFAHTEMCSSSCSS